MCWAATIEVVIRQELEVLGHGEPSGSDRALGREQERDILAEPVWSE